MPHEDSSIPSPPPQQHTTNKTQLPEACFYSSYALLAKGQGKQRPAINEYVELSEYPFLQV